MVLNNSVDTYIFTLAVRVLVYQIPYIAGQYVHDSAVTITCVKTKIPASSNTSPDSGQD